MSADPTPDPPVYVLIKRGLYYRPNAQGYTGVLAEAGLYSAAEARAHTDHADGVTSAFAAESPEFSPACWLETRVKVPSARLEQQGRPETARMQAAVDRITHRQILARARSLCKHTRHRSLPNWSFAMELFGLGSTFAWSLCERMGIDPDATTLTAFPPLAAPIAAPSPPLAPLASEAAP